MVDAGQVWKDQGNAYFKDRFFERAKDCYSSGLKEPNIANTTRVTLLSNRAACHLKLDSLESCIADCSDALILDPVFPKALFRRAVAREKLGELSKSLDDLLKLIKIEPQNREVVELTRRVQESIQKGRAGETEVMKWITVLQQEDPVAKLNAMKAIIELSSDDQFHAIEFGKRGGLSIVVTTLQSTVLQDVISNSDLIVRALRILAVVSGHRAFLRLFLSTVEPPHEANEFAHALSLTSDGKIPLAFIFSLLEQCINLDMVKPTLITVMNVLKFLPASLELEDSQLKKSIEENHIKLDDPISLSLSLINVQHIVQSFIKSLRNCDRDMFPLVADSFAAFLSPNSTYYELDKEVDVRQESLSDRRFRLRSNRIISERAKLHSRCAAKGGIVDLLVHQLDSSEVSIRHSASVLMGKWMKYFDNDEEAKDLFLPFLPGDGSYSDFGAKVQEVFSDSVDIASLRRRAALEAVLLTTNVELGGWALQQGGGAGHLMRLISTGDDRCVEIATEVLCLSATVETMAPFLSHLVETGIFHTLLRSSQPGVRAAAASTITKLTIKAKALTSGASENSLILDAVLGVLKSAGKSQSNSVSSNNLDGDKLVSFSSHDVTADSSKKLGADKSEGRTLPNSELVGESYSTAMTSVERAIEVLAAMVGHTYVKEELVHGSYRTSTCIKELSNLVVDSYSSAAFGIAHIFSQLTVTNRELKAIALAEKEMTVEQHEQMLELQRIKTTDENGNVIEEKKVCSYFSGGLRASSESLFDI